MMIDDLEIKLRQMGYNRENEKYEIEDGILIPKNYNGKVLNHSFLEDCKLIEIEFDNASATGSIYRNCNFNKCSIVQTDFEYCEFYKCNFISEPEIHLISSFNNSSFIETEFNSVFFEFCTFTGAVFQKCTFRDITIKDSTMENAIFNECTFINVNFSDLNMDYVQFERPKMENVILPFSQIPYMFGCLQYLQETNDAVYVGSSDTNIMSKEKYLDEAIPVLTQYWKIQKDTEAEYFFPLSNIYILQKNYIDAVECLKLGIISAIIHQDFRIIKYYCRLISESNMFDYHSLHRFFELIKHLGTSKNSTRPENRTFIRNIGEIESMLFSTYKKGSLFLNIRTNLTTQDSVKIGQIVEKVFSITKMNFLPVPNNTELTLSENSPLLISLNVFGESENIVNILYAFFKIAGIEEDDVCYQAEKNRTLWIEKFELMDNYMSKQIRDLTDICELHNISFSLEEYYICNCEKFTDKKIKTYYYSNNKNILNWRNYQIG